VDVVGEFQRLKDDDMIDALSSVWALVACVDHDLVPKEVSKFFVALNGPGALKEIISPELDHSIRDMTDLMLKDYEKGLQYAIEHMDKVRDDKEKVNLLLALAQKAIVADEDVKESEEAIMKKICEVLKVNPEEY